VGACYWARHLLIELEEAQEALQTKKLCAIELETVQAEVEEVQGWTALQLGKAQEAAGVQGKVHHRQALSALEVVAQLALANWRY
jgi:hypothetical protein